MTGGGDGVASWANPSPDLRERVLADDGSARHVPNATMSASPMSSRLASGVIAREGCQRGGSAAGVDRSWPITTRPLQRMCASILARRCRRGAPGCRRRTGSRSASGRCGTHCGGSGSREKKTFEASERARAEVACSCILWDWLRRKLDLRKLVFLDETWLKTNMSRLYGWARRSVRAVFRVPFEH